MQDLLINALATERLTRLITEDEITKDLRYRIMGRYPDSKVSYLVNCPLCASVWAGGVVVVAKRFTLGRRLLYALALSQMTIHVKELMDG